MARPISQNQLTAWLLVLTDIYRNSGKQIIARNFYSVCNKAKINTSYIPLVKEILIERKLVRFTGTNRTTIMIWNSQMSTPNAMMVESILQEAQRRKGLMKNPKTTDTLLVTPTKEISTPIKTENNEFVNYINKLKNYLPTGVTITITITK